MEANEYNVMLASSRKNASTSGIQNETIAAFRL